MPNKRLKRKARSPRLKNGQACSQCRRLKTKCDGGRPSCTRCRYTRRRPEGCSYVGVDANIHANLEAGFRTLRDPNSTEPVSPSGTAQTAESSIFSGGHSTVPPYLAIEEPVYGHLRASLDAFLPHAYQLGFFMNSCFFRRSALLTFNLGHPLRPTPGLLHTVLLIGTHLSLQYTDAEESVLSTKAIQLTGTDLSSLHPNKVIHTLQAEILLAYYMCRKGRLLEAKCHAGAAITLVLSTGLHKIRSANVGIDPTIWIDADGQGFALPPPVDSLGEAERISGFWAALVLHKLMKAAFERPDNVCGALEAPGLQIDTPWPGDIDMFEETIPSDLLGNGTFRAFVNGELLDSSRDSINSLLAKSAIILHRAAQLVGQWTRVASQEHKDAYNTAANLISSIIDSLRSNLIQIELVPEDPTTLTIIMAKALLDAATIKLHSTSNRSTESSNMRLAAARRMVDYGDLDLESFGGVINPIMGIVWMSACHALMQEITRTGASESNDPDELFSSFKKGIKAMYVFSQNSVLMKSLLTSLSRTKGHSQGQG